MSNRMRLGISSEMETASDGRSESLKLTVISHHLLTLSMGDKLHLAPLDKSKVGDGLIGGGLLVSLN